MGADVPHGHLFKKRQPQAQVGFLQNAHIQVIKHKEEGQPSNLVAVTILRYFKNKYGTSQGIIRDEDAEPIPHLFKVIIKRLIGWHVLPPTCIPNSCVVDIYDEGDFMPPLIDHHDFVRPLCTLSLLNECSILFGTNLQCVEPGVFEGPMALPLPIGSVLVLNGNSADVAKHCMPVVPSKRISITFKKMDNRRLPFSFVPEPDLQTIQPLPYNTKGSRSRRPQKSRNAYSHRSPQIAMDDDHVEEQRSNFPQGGSHVVNRPRPRPRPRPHRSNP
ncbi:hypothetical protein AMTR_s00220p00028550 [Amborella trichopoda]|uniref:Fe2OG dioxygenase domain-containing protein n=1 Tax=Amborella trichopoda TaxID=13333 RepID=W1NSY7_AMBTC|nr:hypothetical protein AMTR_s00220p00028550 [Amborella trichopoda]